MIYDIIMWYANLVLDYGWCDVWYFVIVHAIVWYDDMMIWYDIKYKVYNIYFAKNIPTNTVQVYSADVDNSGNKLTNNGA